MLREFKEGTGDRTRPRSPQEASRGGPGSRAAPIPFQGRTQRYDAAAIWHSVGGKVAGDPRLWKCCKSDTRLVHSRAFVISSACDWRARSFRRPSRRLDMQYCEVLPDGHCACIPVDCVEKTDRRQNPRCALPRRLTPNRAPNSKGNQSYWLRRVISAGARANDRFYESSDSALKDRQVRLYRYEWS